MRRVTVPPSETRGVKLNEKLVLSTESQGLLYFGQSSQETINKFSYKQSR